MATRWSEVCGVGSEYVLVHVWLVVGYGVPGPLSRGCSPSS